MKNLFLIILCLLSFSVNANARDMSGGLGQDSRYNQGGTGAVNSTIKKKLQQTVSILEFIPIAEWSAIYDKTTTYDASDALEEALTGGYGVISLPRGGLLLFLKIKTFTGLDGIEIIGNGCTLKVGSTIAGIVPPTHTWSQRTPAWRFNNCTNIKMHHFILDGNADELLTLYDFSTYALQYFMFTTCTNVDVYEFELTNLRDYAFTIQEGTNVNFHHGYIHDSNSHDRLLDISELTVDSGSQDVDDLFVQAGSAPDTSGEQFWSYVTYELEVLAGGTTFKVTRTNAWSPAVETTADLIITTGKNISAYDDASSWFEFDAQNLDGVGSQTVGIGSITSIVEDGSTGVYTVTSTTHGLSQNDQIEIFSGSTGNFDGIHKVTVLTADTFTITTDTGLATETAEWGQGENMFLETQTGLLLNGLPRIQFETPANYTPIAGDVWSFEWIDLKVRHTFNFEAREGATEGFYSNPGESNSVNNCTFINAGRSNVYANFEDNFSYFNNKDIDLQNAVNIRAVRKCKVYNNTIDNSLEGGLELSGQDFSVTNNTVRNVGAAGISVTASNPHTRLTDDQINWVVTDNTIVDSPNYDNRPNIDLDTEANGGIWVQSAGGYARKNVIVKNNTIYDSRTPNTTKYAVSVFSGSSSDDNISVQNNPIISTASPQIYTDNTFEVREPSYIDNILPTNAPLLVKRTYTGDGSEPTDTTDENYQAPVTEVVHQVIDQSGNSFALNATAFEARATKLDSFDNSKNPSLIINKSTSEIGVGGSALSFTEDGVTGDYTVAVLDTQFLTTGDTVDIDSGSTGNFDGAHVITVVDSESFIITTTSGFATETARFALPGTGAHTVRSSVAQQGVNDVYNDDATVTELISFRGIPVRNNKGTVSKATVLLGQPPGEGVVPLYIVIDGSRGKGTATDGYLIYGTDSGLISHLAGDVGIGGTLGSEEIQLNADGSASFSGAISGTVTTAVNVAGGGIVAASIIKSDDYRSSGNTQWGDATGANMAFLGTITQGGTLLTSTMTELNKLDGAGASVTAANLTTVTDGSDAVGLHFHGPSLVATNQISGNETVAASGVHTVVLDTADIDDTGITLAANQVTVASTGRYLLSYAIGVRNFDNTTASRFTSSVYNVDSVANILGLDYSLSLEQRNTAPGDRGSLTATMEVDLAANDTLELRVDSISSASFFIFTTETSLTVKRVK